MSRLGASPAGPPPVADRSFEVVVFRVGSRRLAVPREQVKHIRSSPRLRSRLRTAMVDAPHVPLISLSVVLGLDRDPSVDRRVLEVEHWGRPLGLEVTAIEGIFDVRPRELHPLPPLVRRSCASANVLGLLDPGRRVRGPGENDTASDPGETARTARQPAVALDLTALLIEQGVEIPGGEEGP